MDCELLKIVLTASFTLIGGVVLLAVTQILTRFVVDPLVDFRRLLGEVGHTLVFYSNYLTGLRSKRMHEYRRSHQAIPRIINPMSPRCDASREHCGGLHTRFGKSVEYDRQG